MAEVTSLIDTNFKQKINDLTKLKKIQHLNMERSAECLNKCKEKHAKTQKILESFESVYETLKETEVI